MAYEFSTERGSLLLMKIRTSWVIEFAGGRAGSHPSAEAAVSAAASHTSGLSAWDALRGVEVSADILDWRPLGDNI